MALTPNVVAGAPILSTWGNTIRNQTVMPFASAAERSAQWVSPPDGACSVLADTNSVLWIYEGATLGWQPAGMRGVLAFVEDSTDNALTSTPINLPSMTATVTVPAGRRTRVKGNCQYGTSAGTAAGAVNCVVRWGASDDGEPRTVSYIASWSVTIVVERIFNLTAGAHTFVLRSAATTSPGCFFQHGSMTVEDVGPA